MADTHSTIAIITLSIDGLNIPIRMQNSSDLIRKQDQTYAVYKRHLKYKQDQKEKKKMTNICHVNTNNEKTVVATLTSAKINFNAIIIGDKEKFQKNQNQYSRKIQKCLIVFS